jgi:hypothetical protein
MKTIREFAMECCRSVVSRHRSDVGKQECNLSHAHMPTTLVGGVQKKFLVKLARTRRT